MGLSKLLSVTSQASVRQEKDKEELIMDEKDKEEIKFNYGCNKAL